MAGGNIMFYLVNDIFINLCILITLTVVYTPLRSKLKINTLSYWQQGVIDGIVSGLSSVLLIVFSIKVAENAWIDLRFIPIMLLVLFAGLFPAVIASIVVIIGRIIISGMTSLSVTTILLMILLIIGFQLIHKLYQPDKATYSKALMMILFSNFVFFGMMMYYFTDYLQLLRFMPVYCIVSIIGGLIAVVFSKYLDRTAMLLSKYEEEASKDFLTGLQNMRSFEATWHKFINKSVTENKKLTLLTMDIDYFKQINDTYGHPAGNQILTEFSDILLKNIRSLDIAFRNGGDEFSIILPDCSLENALEAAKRIQKEVEAHTFQISEEQSICVTVSIGAATYPDTCTNQHQIIQTADKALYKAKQSGKNRIYPSQTSVREGM
ncbi:GGDEF domain-containing protein [Oceanobacillus sojae]|uniref:GGDEF domain-containing protein n=1 Tax=Oceanobacillus sojae TaxID=582851 RepID=UPI0021A8BE66|nr:GGDEF domain-containing protein [Oceanobacillus sojae]MCT1902149.1 diguanylate cyclase [Oceanobacillus sojae]